jgi:uncharacterized membrane protein YphA (DoxX/SURF4 family)
MLAPNPGTVETRAMGTVSIVLAIITGVLFVVTGGVKVLGVKQSLEIRDHFGMQPGLWRIIGTLETTGAVGVLIGLAVPALGVAAAVGLACLMLGAIASRLKVRDSALLILGDVVVLGLVVATGLALLSEV